MRHLKFLTLAVLSGLLLAGCASVAHVEKDETANLSNYHTYAWVETRAEQNDSSGTRVSDLTERRIKEAVNKELAKAGWRQSKNKPDVFMTYDVLVERTIKSDNRPVYSQSTTRYFYNPYTRRWIPVYYPSEFLGYDRAEQAVKEGTVTISVIEAKSEKTIWQGWTTDEVNSRNLTSKETQSAVKSIFKKFDVAKN
jgi:hypothetical protein